MHGKPTNELLLFNDGRELIFLRRSFHRGSFLFKILSFTYLLLAVLGLRDFSSCGGAFLMVEASLVAELGLQQLWHTHGTWDLP